MPGARLSLFLGKGGVGRTTLACAFAVDRAAAGERVLLVSVVSEQDVVERIQHEAAGVDTGGRLELMHVDARRLVDDLVRRITHLGSLADYVTRNPAYESLVDIVPGIREMALVHELEKRRRAAFDRIVLDAPATGHGMHFLEAPEKTSKILAGPLRERAEALRDVLKDPAVTDVVLVTLPEEMPVRETVELVDRMRAQGFPVDNVAVNRWLPRVFVDEGSRRVLDRLPGTPEARTAEARAWLAALRRVAAQRAEAESHLRELERLDVKLSIVPLIPESSRRLPRVAEAMKRQRERAEAAP